jgi:hypothetical protein
VVAQQDRAVRFWEDLVVRSTAAAPAGEEALPGWATPMREVHGRFRGKAGSLALFGDSITVSLAFWAPLEGGPSKPPEDMKAALESVRAHQLQACWRQWRGPEHGNEGGMTIRWAHENVAAWLAKLNPETAVIMFGTNDLSALGRDEYERKAREVAQRCLDNATVPILTTIPPRHGLAAKAAEFAGTVRRIAADLRVPLVDYHAGILERRPDDWDGAQPEFREALAAGGSEYEVPTLVCGDGVHPSNPRAHQDYSAESLRSNGFALRNYLTLLRYAEVIEHVFKP